MSANLFRTKYRELDKLEKAHIEEIKIKAEDLAAAFPRTGPGARHFALARTNLEQAVMWAVKGITEIPESEGVK